MTETYIEPSGWVPVHVRIHRARKTAAALGYGWYSDATSVVRRDGLAAIHGGNPRYDAFVSFAGTLWSAGGDDEREALRCAFALAQAEYARLGQDLEKLRAITNWGDRT